MPFDIVAPEPCVATPVADLLDKAAAFLSVRERWCQNELTDGAGKFCAVGALTAVALQPQPGEEIGNRLFTVDALVSARDIPTVRRAWNLMDIAALQRGYVHAVDLNDGLTKMNPRASAGHHRLVLAMIRHAALLARLNGE